MLALPILCHEHRNLLAGQAAFLSVPSAMPRWAGQVVLSLERHKEIRFVRLDQGRKLAAVFLGRMPEHPVPPAKRRGPVDAGKHGGLAYAQSVNQRLAIGQPGVPAT